LVALKAFSGALLHRQARARAEVRAYPLPTWPPTEVSAGLQAPGAHLATFPQLLLLCDERQQQRYPGVNPRPELEERVAPHGRSPRGARAELRAEEREVRGPRRHVGRALRLRVAGRRWGYGHALRLAPP